LYGVDLELQQVSNELKNQNDSYLHFKKEYDENQLLILEMQSKVSILENNIKSLRQIEFEYIDLKNILNSQKVDEDKKEETLNM